MKQLARVLLGKRGVRPHSGESATRGRRRPHRRTWFALVLVIVATGVFVALHGLSATMLSVDEATMSDRFLALGARLRTHSVRFTDNRIGYRSVGPGNAPVVLFLHGSPGRWDNFASVMSSRALLDRAQLISIDRPGFGASRAFGPRPELAFQAMAAAQVIDQHAPDRPVIVVGHSYGASIAAWLGVERAERVVGLVLIAGPLDPALERLRWYNHLAAWWPVRTLLPRPLVHSNAEMLPLRDELVVLRDRLAAMSGRVTVLQGARDRLVDPANAHTIPKLFTCAEVDVQLLPGRGHFIPWQDPERVVAAVADHLDRLAADPSGRARAASGLPGRTCAGAAGPRAIRSASSPPALD